MCSNISFHSNEPWFRQSVMWSPEHWGTSSAAGAQDFDFTPWPCRRIFSALSKCFCSDFSRRKWHVMLWDGSPFATKLLSYIPLLIAVLRDHWHIKIVCIRGAYITWHLVYAYVMKVFLPFLGLKRFCVEEQEVDRDQRCYLRDAVKVYHIGLENRELAVFPPPARAPVCRKVSSTSAPCRSSSASLAGFCCSSTAPCLQKHLIPGSDHHLDYHTSHIICKPYACAHVLMETGRGIGCKGMLSRWNILISGNIKYNFTFTGWDTACCL